MFLRWCSAVPTAQQMGLQSTNERAQNCLGRKLTAKSILTESCICDPTLVYVPSFMHPSSLQPMKMIHKFRFQQQSKIATHALPRCVSFTETHNSDHPMTRSQLPVIYPGLALTVPTSELWTSIYSADPETLLTILQTY